ncbi:hypothetical protein ACELLULO517_10020 [Acidisoma cellulosilytica]|uniref:Glycosyltransferase family 9 protein n=1 Tax=Acidisoma cellulosilyticum TaxID=2802395 RepID=A0A963Z129_9PROT|nr:glycosyltransferase family 9 protein [Acidisoma cellulosilyticum]MCB8880569.1 hypothetical protein [Acidisoma cellulosilyticum]
MGLTTVLNGFGISLGDGIIGLQALSIARAMGAVQGRVVLGRQEPPAKPLVPQLYQRAANLAEIMPMEIAPRDGRVIDIRDFAHDPGFACISMIDFFLGKLGIDPATVASDQKRNSWLAPRLGVLPVLDLPKAYVLLCPHASIALRDMPPEPQAALLRGLAARGFGPVVTQGAPMTGGIAAPFCETIEALAALVAGARAVVSTDTAILHLADAYSVPCLAFMTTHRPEWRVRDYPFCLPYRLPVTGVPESAEFVRSEEDLKAVHDAWFPDGPGLGWVGPLLDQFKDFAAARA